MNLIQKDKAPNVEYFDNFYNEYIQKIKNIYDNYSQSLDGCDLLDDLIKEMLSDFTTSIDKINNTMDKISYISNNQQTARAILTESYKYLSCRSKDDIYYSSLDIFDNMGITVKHSNIKQYDYDIEDIISNYPRMQINTTDIIGKSDSDIIIVAGVYFGNFYGQVKSFEIGEKGYDKTLLLDNDEIMDIEYVTENVLSDSLEISLVIKPLTTLNKIDVLYLSLLSLENCFINVKNIQYKFNNDSVINQLDYIQDLTVYPSANSKYTDIYIPLHLNNVEIIIVNLKQSLCLTTLVKRIYCGSRLLNMLETLVVDKTYSYNVYSDEQWTPDQLNVSIGDIVDNSSISNIYVPMNRYYIGIRNIKLLGADTIKSGELIFNPINIDTNVVAIEINVDDNSDLFKYYISFDNNNIWYQIVPANKFNGDGVYRYYIRQPSTIVQYENGISKIYDVINVKSSYTIKVVGSAIENNYNMLLRSITIREKNDD